MSKKELLAVAGGFVAGIAAVGLFRSLKKKEERKIDSPEGMDEDFDLEEIWDEELDEEYDPEKDSLLKNPGSEQKAYCDELEDKPCLPCRMRKLKSLQSSWEHLKATKIIRELIR